MVPLIANGADADDMPSLVEAHADHLFLAYKGGFYIHSGPSNPLSWSGLLGAEQFAVGDEITGIATHCGGRAARDLPQSDGRPVRDIPRPTGSRRHSELVGDPAGTLQSTFIPVGLSERGLVRLDRVQEYGDFSLNLLDPSEKIQPIIEQFNWVGSSCGWRQPVSALLQRRPQSGYQDQCRWRHRSDRGFLRLTRAGRVAL